MEDSDNIYYLSMNSYISGGDKTNHYVQEIEIFDFNMIPEINMMEIYKYNKHYWANYCDCLALNDHQ